MQIDTRQHFNELSTRIQEVNQQLMELSAQTCTINDDQALEQLEQKIRSILNELGDLIVAQKVQQQIDTNEELHAQSTKLARAFHKSLVNKGRALVQIRFVGGTQLPLSVTY